MCNSELSSTKKRKRTSKKTSKSNYGEKIVPPTTAKPVKVQHSDNETDEDVTIKEKKQSKTPQVETVTQQSEKLESVKNSKLSNDSTYSITNNPNTSLQWQMNWPLDDENFTRSVHNNSTATSLSQQTDSSSNDEDDNFKKNSDNKTWTDQKLFGRKICKKSDTNFKSNNTLNRTFPICKSKSNNYTRFDRPGNSYAPYYKNHQLIGDSQLLRFAEKLLHYRRNIIPTSKHQVSTNWGVGYCISGQKTDDLKQKLLEKPFEICDKVILLIGTNDLLNNIPISSICDNFVSIINILLENAVQRIVILTVPPVPKLGMKHMTKLQHFNMFITNQAKEDKIIVLDLASLFISYNNTISLNYFEETFWHKNKPDLIHMNVQGLKMLQNLLYVLYFGKK